MSRRTYRVAIRVNGCSIDEVVIDPHYEKKHPDITDALILNLVAKLDRGEFQPEMTRNGFEFFMLDRIPLNGKQYRLVWCMQKGCLYMGVINAFRRK